MVERPIKKSERLAAQPDEKVTETPKPKPNLDRSADRDDNRRDGNRRDEDNRSPRRGDGRDRGRGKGKEGDRADKPPVNPALVRGPRPVKPKPVEELPPESVEEATDTAESTAAETEATEA